MRLALRGATPDFVIRIIISIVTNDEFYFFFIEIRNFTWPYALL